MTGIFFACGNSRIPSASASPSIPGMTMSITATSNCSPGLHALERFLARGAGHDLHAPALRVQREDRAVRLVVIDDEQAAPLQRRRRATSVTVCAARRRRPRGW